MIISIAAAIISMGLPTRGLANGGSFFDFDGSYKVPGESVTGETTFSTEVKEYGLIEDGPYFAYLVPGDQWISPPRIPDPSVALGPITITTLNGGLAAARTTFTVPDVEPGLYNLSLCNSPCRQATLGDLVGGTFRIVATREDVLRNELLDLVDARLARVREGLRGKIRDVQKAQRELALRSEVQDLGERLGELEERVARLQNERSREAPGTQTAPWILVGIVTAFVGMLLVRRPRRTGATTRPMRTMKGSIPMFSDSSAFDGQEDLSVEGSSGRALDPTNV
jgi:hypothetical protein